LKNWPNEMESRSKLKVSMTFADVADQLLELPNRRKKDNKLLIRLLSIIASSETDSEYWHPTSRKLWDLDEREDQGDRQKSLENDD
jgi:hypothetical protein